MTSQNDETATQQRLYRCARCGQPLGLLLDDGRIEVTLEGGQVWRLVQGVLDCVCGVRQPLRRDERVLPPFVKRHYPDGTE